MPLKPEWNNIRIKKSYRIEKKSEAYFFSSFSYNDFRNDVTKRTRRDDYTTVTITRPAKNVRLMSQTPTFYKKYQRYF